MIKSCEYLPVLSEISSTIRSHGGISAISNHSSTLNNSSGAAAHAIVVGRASSNNKMGELKRDISANASAKADDLETSESNLMSTKHDTTELTQAGRSQPSGHSIGANTNGLPHALHKLERDSILG